MLRQRLFNAKLKSVRQGWPFNVATGLGGVATERARQESSARVLHERQDNVAIWHVALCCATV